MFGKREACPALVNGSIPARRPGGSVAEGRYLADEETIHYGFIPRTNRGVFACNELPDLTADSRNKAPFPGRGRSLRPNSDVPPVPTSGRRNAPATRDLRHAVVSGTRGSVDGRRALRRATIRLRRAKGPPHGLVILPGGRTVRRSGARSREPRAGVPRGLSMPYTRRRMDASPGGTSARHPQGPASPHAKEARTHQRRCLEAQVARRRDEERRAARGEALASAARRPRHRHDARLPFMMNALPGADGGWSGDPRHSASRIGSAGRRTSPAPAPAR